jgi:hypothetical protein
LHKEKKITAMNSKRRDLLNRMNKRRNRQFKPKKERSFPKNVTCYGKEYNYMPVKLDLQKPPVYVPMEVNETFESFRDKLNDMFGGEERQLHIAVDLPSDGTIPDAIQKLVNGCPGDYMKILSVSKEEGDIIEMTLDEYTKEANQ